MKRYSILILAAAFSMLATSCGKQAGSSMPETPVKFYDTALFMLREFILEGPDSNLGFTNFDELNDIRIDTTKGINIYYALEDSLVNDSAYTAQHLLKMGRMIYPIYYHDQLRSAVTYDTTPYGWRPTVFENSSIISPIIAAMEKGGQGAADSATYAIYVAPFIHQKIAAVHTTQGDYILPTNSLKQSMGEDYPNSGDTAKLAPVKKEDFFKAMRQHMLKVHARRKEKNGKAVPGKSNTKN